MLPKLKKDLTSQNTNLVQNVIYVNSRAAGNAVLPDVLYDPFSLGQDFPIGGVFRLQPLKVINLVPLILCGSLILGHLYGLVSSGSLYNPQS